MLYVMVAEKNNKSLCDYLFGPDQPPGFQLAVDTYGVQLHGKWLKARQDSKDKAPPSKRKPLNPNDFDVVTF